MTAIELLGKHTCVCEDTEAMVLGTAALSPAARTVLIASLSETDFYADAHRAFYRSLAASEALQAPLAGLTAIVRATGDETPTKTISDFQACAELDSTMPYLCDLLREYAQKRNMAATTLDAMRTEGLTLAEVQERVTAGMVSAKSGTPSMSGSEMATGHAALLEARRTGSGGMGILTPWQEFNQITGGFRGGEHWVLGARTSIGKTAFAIEIAIHAARCGERVLMVSLEMDAGEQLADRVMACMSGVSLSDIKTGHVGAIEGAMLAKAREELSALPIEFMDKSACTIRDVYVLAKRLPAKHGLLILDSLQLLTADDRRKDRRIQIGEFSRRLKIMAGDCSIPILTVSSITRPQERKGKSQGMEREPTRFDLKESGDIENDADGIILLHRSDYGAGERFNPVSDLDVIIDKQRNGAVGRFMLRFDRARQTVRSR